MLTNYTKLIKPFIFISLQISIFIKILHQNGFTLFEIVKKIFRCQDAKICCVYVEVFYY